MLFTEVWVHSRLYTVEQISDPLNNQLLELLFVFTLFISQHFYVLLYFLFMLTFMKIHCFQNNSRGFSPTSNFLNFKIHHYVSLSPVNLVCDE